MDRQGIPRVLTPLYHRAGMIAEELASLQESHKQYSNNAKMDAELSVLAEGLKKVEKFEFKLETRLEMRHSISEVKKYLKDYPEIPKKLEICLDNLSKLFDRLVLEHKLLREFDKLCPADGTRGLIEQLVAYRRGEAMPAGFKPKNCEGEIERVLSAHSTDLFPEAKDLLALIKRTKNPSAKDFMKTWEQLSGALQKVRKTHESKKRSLIRQLQNSRAEFHLFNEEKRAGYTLRKIKSREEMAHKTTHISDQLALMQADAAKIEKYPQYPLTESRIGAGAAVATAGAATLGALAGGMSGWFNPLTGATVAASTTSAFINRFAKKKNLSKVVDKDLKIPDPFAWSAVAGTVSAAVPAAMSYPNHWFLNGAAEAAKAGLLAGSAFVGYKAGSAATKQLVETVGQDKLLPEVTRYFENAFELLTDSKREDLVHGAITRFMKSTILALH